MEPQRQSSEPSLTLSLESYHISEEYGFLLPNPLKELPDHYKPWMEIASKLPLLIESHQLRAHVYKNVLIVWIPVLKVLPRALAIPFVEVSRNLGLPPILVHSDLVLTNWTKRNQDSSRERAF
ncbi:indoleamine 2,3-dioxygenase 2-like isoform X2 [Nannospalax galili]|uniref:indoleamine 2,3-dioxygenase 2-like isoform X2 n=1 Tax=Nannospalax galili TaxID=1026970 RepID=UPI00111BDF1A|nr:indoleamine 2,3-dioxygenase 2-like isoform X2 [Nannospalax galili]